MKKVVSLILLLSLLLSMISCGGTQQPVTDSSNSTAETKEDKKTFVDPWKKPEEEKEPNNYTVEDKSVKEKLAAIPIANDSMSSDELRQICLDFMRLQCSFTWMPSERFDHEKLAIPREPGTVYGGIPYISTGSGNIYRAMEYYDSETGILDLSYLGKNAHVFGNACSGGVGWSWGRCINSADYSWTWSLTHNNGCLRVGPYTYPDSVKNFSEVNSGSPNYYTPAEVVLKNGEQTMYESYAQVLPADGLVHPGHVRMVASVPKVVRNEDGTINGQKSTLTYCDQVHYVTEKHHDATQSDGTPYKIQGGVDVKVSFSSLYKTKYIPFTFGEFLGTDPVEKAEVELTVDTNSPSISLKELSTAHVKCNYNISDVFFTVKTPDGKELFKRTYRAERFFVRDIDLFKKAMVSSVTNLMKTHINGENVLEITCRVSTGELIPVYTGILAE